MRINLHNPMSNIELFKNCVRTIPGDFTKENINKHLIQYNCQYRVIMDEKTNRQVYYLDFDSNEDHVMFVLKWS